MDIVLISLVATLLLTVLLTVKYAVSLKNRVYNEIIDYFTPPDHETPSQFAQLLQASSKILANEIMIVLSANVMQAKSAMSKNVKAVEGAVMQDMVTAQSPLLGLGIEALPNVKKLLNKRPELWQLVGALAQNLGKGAGGSAPGNGSGNYAAQLGKYG